MLKKVSNSHHVVPVAGFLLGAIVDLMLLRKATRQVHEGVSSLRLPCRLVSLPQLALIARRRATQFHCRLHCVCAYSGRMHQRRVVSNNDGAAHIMPGSSPTSHRVRQRNGFLRPSSAGVVSSAQRLPASVRTLRLAGFVILAALWTSWLTLPWNIVVCCRLGHATEVAAGQLCKTFRAYASG